MRFLPILAVVVVRDELMLPSYVLSFVSAAMFRNLSSTNNQRQLIEIKDGVRSEIAADAFIDVANSGSVAPRLMLRRTRLELALEQWPSYSPADLSPELS